MLKGIPDLLSPEMLKTLMEMGHGDEIVLVDANYPAAACARRLLRADGHGAAELLRAILQLFPLDTYADPLFLMEKVKGDPVATPIWDEFREIVRQAEPDAKIRFLERYDFYERSRNAYAIVATGERALYGNILLKKGVISG